MLAEKAERSAPRFFSYFKLSEVFQAYCFRLSDLFVSGFPNFLFENFLRFGHDLSVRYLFVQNIDEDRKPGFSHDLPEMVLFGSFLIRLYGKLTPFPKFLCLP